ncbi:MAG: zinc ribbon domain-containing protein [Anaerolineaceae bacterium]
MNKVWKWILIFVGALIVVFLIAMAVLSRFGFGHMGYLGGFRRGYGMMGWGMMGFHPLGWLLGLAVLGFAIYGVVALFSGRRHVAPPPMPKTCSNCGRVVESGWVSCPYCGHDLHESKPEEMKSEEPKPEENKPQ